MARKVESEEERLSRINLIKEYVLFKINNGEKISTRSVAKYFTENKFPISNATVSTYLYSLEKTDLESYKIISGVLYSNKSKTDGSDEIVKTRINVVVDLLLQDFTVEEIASELGVSVNTIYRDLNSRLEKMDYDSEKLKQIKEVLNRHSMRNLKNQTPKQRH